MSAKSRSRQHAAKGKQVQAPIAPRSGWVGRPVDGSQYIDVVEEQEYADRRPSPEEQTPIMANREKKH